MNLDDFAARLARLLPAGHGRSSVTVRGTSEDLDGLRATLLATRVDPEGVLTDTTEQVTLLVPRGHQDDERVGDYLDGWAAALPALLEREDAAPAVPSPDLLHCPPLLTDETLTTPAQFRDRLLEPSGPLSTWRRQVLDPPTEADRWLDQPDEGYDAWAIATPRPDVGAELRVARERLGPLAARFEATYGLRLPRTLDVFVAFHGSLPPAAREAYGHLDELRPGGILDLLDQPDLPTREGLDLRLHHRYRSTPPELVVVLRGGGDGHHVGLWYDDPALPPQGLVSSRVRDAAEVYPAAATLLAYVSARIRELVPAWLDDGLRRPMRLLREHVAVFRPADHAARAEDDASQPRRWDERTQLTPTLGGIGVAAPGGGYDAIGVRPWTLRRLLDDGGPRLWEGPIASAREALGRGLAGPAIAVGRDLHRLDLAAGYEALQPVALELLVAGYRLLGRDALARIAEVHHAHRDLPEVDLIRATTASP